MLNPSIEVAEKNINALNLVNYFLKPLYSKLIHQNYYVRNYLENIKIDDLCSTIPPIPCPFFEVLSIEGLSNYFGKLEPLGHWLYAFLNDWNPDHQSKGNLDAIIHHLIFSTKET